MATNDTTVLGPFRADDTSALQTALNGTLVNGDNFKTYIYRGMVYVIRVEV